MKTMFRVAALVIIVAALAGCSQKGFNTNLTIEPNPTPGVDWTPYKNWSFGRQGEYFPISTRPSSASRWAKIQSS